MPIDKGDPQEILASAVVALATTRTSAWFNWLEKMAMTTKIRVTNGGTGPNQRPIITIEEADDDVGTNGEEVYRITTSMDNDERTVLIHHHDKTDRYVRVITANPGDQGITTAAWAHFVDNLG